MNLNKAISRLDDCWRVSISVSGHLKNNQQKQNNQIIPVIFMLSAKTPYK